MLNNNSWFFLKKICKYKINNSYRKTNISDDLFIAGQVEKYHLPYYDCVEPDPSREQMHEVVCIDGRRPYVPESWQQEKVRMIF